MSDWRYVPWRRVSYPKGLQQPRELEYASDFDNDVKVHAQFDAIALENKLKRKAAEQPPLNKNS
jgi:uncharacterized protein YecE (DUF72 family)